MVRKEIKKLVEKAVKQLYKKSVEVNVEQTQNSVFGDYSTNLAMVLKKNPQEIAGAIESSLVFEKIEVKNGFINFFLSKDYLQKQVKEILKQGNKFGQIKTGKGKKINLEFISANPTGPLTLGNGRGGFCGDVLANILDKAGFKTTKEFYLNDAGEQVRKLGSSIAGEPLGEEGAFYKGPYIEELKKRMIKERTVGKAGEKAAKIILKEMIKPAIKKMKIKFDVWFSEKSLHKSGEIEKVLNCLRKKSLAYEKKGALWFKSSKFGDDKDRVLIKDNGQPTYLLSDIAYLKNKFERKFDLLFFFWGADHYGYVGRIKAAAEALGYSKDNLKIIITQLVRLIKKGKEIKMSKRAGIYITLDELIDEVGLDIARFFFLTRSLDAHLNFDLELAKEKSEKNPVYYVQYAYARICSILRKRKNKNKLSKTTIKNLKLLNQPSELNLIKQLIKLPEIIEDVSRDYQVQRLPQYATDLAAAFHRFYKNCKVLDEGKKIEEARLSLALSTKIVLKNILDLMGISAPEKM
jgi:arginyl-tRNA synthetase